MSARARLAPTYYVGGVLVFNRPVRGFQLATGAIPSVLWCDTDFFFVDN
jgi:hypothetical protein